MSDKSPNIPVPVVELEVISEVCEDDKLRFQGIFARLDKNQDGTVNVADLSEALGGTDHYANQAKVLRNGYK